MVHPRELLRANSEGREFAAPVPMLSENPIDCGLSNLPCLSQIVNLERLAKAKIYLLSLCLVGFLHGATLTYFRRTSAIWGVHYNISPDIIDWLIYTNEFFIGIFGLLVSYWGNRIHRMSWIGALAMFQAIASLILIVPEVYRQDYKAAPNTIDSIKFCSSATIVSKPADVDFNHIAVVVIIVYQVFYCMASISFLSHGITYLDDNTSTGQSPAYIAIALASLELGKQAGTYLAGLQYFFPVDNIFVSFVWISIAIATLAAGSIISMFPRTLPLALLDTVAASILDLATGQHFPPKKEIIDGFFKTLYRLIRNKVLMINILWVVLVQSALINFSMFEKYFNQSQYFVSSKTESGMVQLATDLLTQPLVAISIIATGMVIAKTKPHPKSLVIWNMIVLVFVILMISSTAFLKCNDDKSVNIEGHFVMRPSCSLDCTCNPKEFQPVCLEGETYFSPCLAGCKNSINPGIYADCRCSYGASAYEGACDAKKCNTLWTLSQANRVLSTALLASTLVTNLMINLRCIVSRDKAMALGLEATLLGLIPYLPIKAIYGTIAENMCKEHDNQVCVVYSRNFALFLSSATLALVAISLVLNIMLYFFTITTTKPRREDDASISMQLDQLNAPLESDGGNSSRYPENEESHLARRVSGADSLLEMENVGDDHDSIGSIGSLRRTRLIETDF